ncbi:MAG: ATP phosphoribosyltransferase regulatory subunit, partial [Sulfitobacter sp.]
MAKPKKTPRPKAQTPKGFRDYFGTEVTHRAEMLSKIAAVYHRYGFDALESSGVETVEALGKFLPDVDRPNEGVFAWQEDSEGDKPGDWLALRYDLTAPLARVYAQHRNDLPMPYRRYAMGPVWRNEKPGPGRFRQFYQCDADTVGAPSVAADAEICAMLADCLEEVGIARGDYVVRVNNRKVLDGAIQVALYGDELTARNDGNHVQNLLDTFVDDIRMSVSEQAHTQILRTIDKFDKVGFVGVSQLLTTGRKDESGAFIEGVGLSTSSAEKVLEFLHARKISNEHTLAALDNLVGQTSIGRQGVDELREIADLLAAQGYGPDRIAIDPSVVRGLGYYTGPVFEAELTFEIKDEKG